MPTTMSYFSSSLPEHWTYISEGGANIVFRYSGPPSASLDGKVLRLRKVTEVSGPSLSLSTPSESPSAFRDRVIAPLLAEEFLPRQEHVSPPSSLLAAMDEASRSRRPSWRVERGGIDLDGLDALLVDDLTGPSPDRSRPILAVEIKPKWGFLPSADHLSSTTRDLKRTHCRFCMHQRLKSSASKSGGVIAETSEYCPLDLYSGNPVRVERALGGLWDGWCAEGGAGNNLKLFVDGTLVSPAEPDRLAQVLAASASESSLRSTFLSHLAPIISSSRFFPLLAQIQASLDPLDIEGLASRVLKTSPNALPSPATVHQPSAEEFAAFVSRYGDSASPLPPPKEWSDRDLVISFLLSATFKDCSVIVRVPLECSGRPSATPIEIKAIDLDPKSVDRLAKWYRLDEEIVAHAGRVIVEGDRRCVDGGRVREGAAA